MQFGCNFHAGSKTDAATRIRGAVSLPPVVAQLSLAAVDALGGDPSIVKVAIAGEHKGDCVSAIAITLTTNVQERGA